jgi:hypothetical protein
MDYINLKFRIALTKNKINVKQEKFIQESDILDIYEKLKNYPKPTTSKQPILAPNKSAENIKKAGTFAHISNSLGDFAEDVCNKLNMQIVISVANKFNDIEPKLFE